jgi:hypothetical protein
MRLPKPPTVREVDAMSSWMAPASVGANLLPGPLAPSLPTCSAARLARYIAEANPSLADVAQVAALLAERHLLVRGL